MDARVGWWIDGMVGGMSRLLHGLRGAEHDTTGDLGPYLDRAPEELFPAPLGVPHVALRRSPAVLPGLEVSSLRFASQHEPVCPRYRERHERDYAVNRVAHARWMRRKHGPRKQLLVYVHGWLEPGPFIEESTLLPMLERRLDVDVAHVQLPFHGKRNPKSALFHGEFFWSADLVRSIEAVRQSVLDVRTAIEWFRARGYEQIGVTGMSLGGSITMLLACLRPTPDWIVPIVSHLKLSEAVEQAPILWRMKSDLEKWGVDRPRREELFRHIGLDDLHPALASERQLWVAARGDMYLTAPLVERQWEEWRRPPIVWIPTGHMTFPLALGTILDRMATFHRALPPGRAPG